MQVFTDASGVAIPLYKFEDNHTRKKHPKLASFKLKNL